MSSRPIRPDGSADLKPVRVAFLYALFSLGWIFGSGWIVAAFTSGTSSTELELGKGAGFVFITAAALYVLLARRARSIRAAQAAEAAADEQRLRLATAVEQAAETIIMTDQDGRITYVNPAFEQLSGYARADLLGLPTSLLAADPDDGSTAPVEWPAPGSTDIWRGTLLNRRLDGSTYEAETTISPIRDSSGGVSGYVALQRDVSRELALERDLAEAGRMEAVGQLAGGIAHDFNNLLTAVAGYAELLRDEVRDNRNAQTDVEEILRASRSAAGLVKQLLALARRQMLAPAALQLDELVAVLRPMLEGVLGPLVNLDVQIAGPIEPVFADAGQIEQVLINLAANARDAMPNGGTFTLSISNSEVEPGQEPAELVGLVEPGRYVRMVATDTGHGMDQATLARVFEPFFTTKPVGKGTGLGLATTYGIIKQSGGFLFADSEVGHGSTFNTYLPRYDGPVAERPAHADAMPSPGGSETILIVEDDPAVQGAVGQTLEKLGYRVLISSNARQAMAYSAAEAGRVALLVTDIRLPGTDGASLAAQLRVGRPGLRVLYVSGYAGDEMVRSGLLAPNEAFLAKPFTSDDLARRVRGLIDGDGTH